MNSAHAPYLIQLAQDVIQNDTTKAVPLLKLLNAFATARGDPLEEANERDVMLWLYSQTDHCEEAMRELISQGQPTESPMIA